MTILDNTVYVITVSITLLTIATFAGTSLFIMFV